MGVTNSKDFLCESSSQNLTLNTGIWGTLGVGSHGD